MKQKTLLLFQLLLAVYAFYTVLNYTGNMRFIVPLFCLIGMFVISKVETAWTERSKGEKAQSEVDVEDDTPKTAFNPLECLLKSKNVLLLTDAIHHIFRDLGLEVSPSPDHLVIDRLLRVPGKQVTFGLKIFGDVAEVSADWDKWDQLTEFNMGKGGKRRLVVIGSNCVPETEGSQQKFLNFSKGAQKFLSDMQVVAMTTLTLYKIYTLCKKRNLDPKVILQLVHQHPGGVFQLEQYAKRSTKAA